VCAGFNDCVLAERNALLTRQIGGYQELYSANVIVSEQRGVRFLINCDLNDNIRRPYWCFVLAFGVEILIIVNTRNIMKVHGKELGDIIGLQGKPTKSLHRNYYINDSFNIC
jgi:hypothetical protein